MTGDDNPFPIWPANPSQALVDLQAVYIALREDCIRLELIINEIDEHDAIHGKLTKRLDKAVTVAKFAFKVMKKAIKAQAERESRGVGNVKLVARR
jgi:hypothetical protein